MGKAAQGRAGVEGTEIFVDEIVFQDVPIGSENFLCIGVIKIVPSEGEFLLGHVVGQQDAGDATQELLCQGIVIHGFLDHAGKHLKNSWQTLGEGQRFFPQIFFLGEFIRKTSIDELPQLVNIIAGDMSIVGPRAIQKTQEYTPHEAQRMVVQPGLSCYWQISGRSNVSWEDWVELDLDYIQDMSVWTDVKIIAKTFGVVFKGTGSY